MKFLVFIGIFLFLALIPASSASVVISEILYDANSSDTGKEFVELYNPTPQEIDLTDWKLQVGNGAEADDWSDEVTFGYVMPAHSFYLIGEANVTGADVVDILDLQNGPDAVRIIDSEGEIVDLVGYGNEGDFDGSGFFEGSPMEDVTSGHSLERRPGFLNPSRGNGYDSNNNSADFLDNPTPEPQNSGVTETPVVVVTRSVLGSYPSDTEVTVTLDYSFNEDQVGLIVKEINPWITGSTPESDFFDGSLSKWLFTDKISIPTGSITYTFVTPSAPGTYSISGGWESVDNNNGTLYIGSSGVSEFTVLSDELSGFVEDVFGRVLGSVLISLGGETSTTDQDGFYTIAMPDAGGTITASLSGYLTEEGTVSPSDTEFDFVGDFGLVPEEVKDPWMLTAVSRWSKDFFGDTKLLEVVHQWANTPA